MQTRKRQLGCKIDRGNRVRGLPDAKIRYSQDKIPAVERNQKLAHLGRAGIKEGGSAGERCVAPTGKIAAEEEAIKDFHSAFLIIDL